MSININKQKKKINLLAELEPMEKEIDAFISYEEEKHYKDLAGLDDEDDFSPEYDPRIMRLIKDRDVYYSLCKSLMAVIFPEWQNNIERR